MYVPVTSTDPSTSVFTYEGDAFGFVVTKIFVRGDPPLFPAVQAILATVLLILVTEFIVGC